MRIPRAHNLTIVYIQKFGLKASITKPPLDASQKKGIMPS